MMKNALKKEKFIARSDSRYFHLYLVIMRCHSVVLIFQFLSLIYGNVVRQSSTVPRLLIISLDGERDSFDSCRK